MAGAREDLQAAVLEGSGDGGIVGPRRLWIVAAHTDQRRGGGRRWSPGSIRTGGIRVRSTNEASR